MSLSSRLLLPFSPTNGCFILSRSHCSFFHSLTSQSPTINCFSRSSTRICSNFKLSELTIAAVTDARPAEDGPIELSPSGSGSTFFATSDDPTPLQSAATLLLTGAIAVLLFRSLLRRAKRARENRFRSTGEKKSLKEEALENLKSVTLTPTPSKSQPKPLDAFLGALAAGAVALILYKFTTTVESSLDRQTLSDNYSVRQITITIRTIINGLCYLATFVFGANSVGLFLYSGQLAINSSMGDPSSYSEEPSSSSGTKSSSTVSSEIASDSEDQSWENTE